MRTPRLLQTSFIYLCLFLVFLYVEKGFWHADPHYLALDPHGFHRLALWMLRICTPLFGLYLCRILWLATHQRMRRSTAWVCATAVPLCACFGMYLCALTGKDTMQLRTARNIHPYLQIQPTEHGPVLRNTSKEAFSIVFLGGSSTEFADSKGLTWTARVQKEMPHTRIYNAGKQWYTSLHSLIHYQTHFQHHPPHMVVVMHTLNDVLHNADFSYFSKGPFQKDYGHFYGPLSAMVQNPSLIHNAYHALQRLWYHTPRTVLEQHHFPGLASYENHLRTLIDTAQRNGTQVVLMTEAHLYKPHMTPQELNALYMLNIEAVGPTQQWNHTTVLRAMDAYNNTVRALAQEKNIPLIDLDKTVPKSLTYFYDDVHFQDHAFNTVASAVVSHLQPLVSRFAHVAHNP
jgi:hypothetical protein